ncbi:DUF2249 domain-containing protein [Microlunatus elymi]|uniref:DUF2249 domain-containing protein n=1 Tax=Microlunatus elymi TaxID=2596828 RepID=UPI00143D008A|nr:DUF2249 domain-containing protein [Microlunatus elymi]
MPEAAQTDRELDVRKVRKPDRHPMIFARFRELAVGEGFVLINDHDPRHLRDEFENELPGSYGWEYLNQVNGDWQIKISRLTETPLPRVLANTASLADAQPDAAGVIWKLPINERDLDSNVIGLAPGGRIDPHAGPELDVLIHVLAGSGTLTTESGTLDLTAGDLLWLPRRSRRSFAAGDDGLRYLTVHQRRASLQLDLTALQRTTNG